MDMFNVLFSVLFLCFCSESVRKVKQVTTLPWHFTPKGALYGPIYGIYVG